MARSSRVLTSQESREIDVRAKEEFGIPVLVLMENAGRQVALESIKMLRGNKGVAVFCGKGNNGGDGFVAARHLLASGIKADVFLAGKIHEVKNEARLNLEILLKLRRKIAEVDERNIRLLKNKITKYALIIDALLGVGLKGQVRGVYRELIELVNLAGVKILSVDIPSGLDATTGEILGACVKAERTVTFVARKRGMVVGEGPKVCGEIIVRDLGIIL